MDGWVIPEKMPPLEEGTVQVWRLCLDGSRELLPKAYAVLSERERERAAKMREGRPREEFVAGRGCLRWLLGLMRKADPRELEFEFGEHGKPRLEGGPAFNVAHAKGLIFIATSAIDYIGVDLELPDDSVESLDVARTVFHASDVERIEGSGTPEKRLAEFYRCWTRREAVGKADGRGLLLPPEAYAVGTDSGGEQEIVVGAEGLMRRVFVQEIDAGGGYMAALATSRGGLRLRFFEVAGESSWLFGE